MGKPIGRTVIPELLAPNYGAAEGKRWPEVIAAFGQTPALAPQLPLADGAESWISLVQRTSRELEAIVRRHYGETVMVVGHEETVVAAAQHFLQLLPWSRAEVTFGVDFTSQTVWHREALCWCEVEEGRWQWRLEKGNDTRHLVEMVRPSPTRAC